MKWLKSIFLGLLVLIFSGRFVYAFDCSDAELTKAKSSADPAVLRQFIDNCKSALSDTQNQERTLKSALTVINTKIKLTEAQIAQTTVQIAALEKDIGTLSSVVNDLSSQLDDLVKVYVARVRASYIHREVNSIVLFLSSDSFSTFFTRMRYMSIAKAKDQLVLTEITSARQTYDLQKNTKIEKQKQVEELKSQYVLQQTDLSNQQKAKNNLLKITQNNESVYDSLTKKAQAELEAVEAIIARKGKETESRDVNQGDVIAHVISGASCNSGGTHLHFTVANDSTDLNPFNYLKSVDFYDNSGGDSFSPSGSWDWPLIGKIRFNQGYGVTWAIKNLGLWYSRHNGIDISGDSDQVRAVQAGKLYLGSYNGNNGCLLKYVRVHHKDGGLETYYLHVNYN